MLGWRIRSEEIGVCPSPEVTMPVPAVMTLHSESQGTSLEVPVIEGDPSRECRVGVWSARETDPALGAQRDAEGGPIAQIPGNRVSLNLRRTTAEILSNAIVGDLKVEWTLPFGAEVQAVQREPLKEALRFPFARKPGGPYLNGHSLGMEWATASSGIHPQVAKPPCLRPAISGAGRWRLR